jgi:hypothetical protein
VVEHKLFGFRTAERIFDVVRGQSTGIFWMTIEQANAQPDRSRLRENFARPQPVT